MISVSTLRKRSATMADRLITIRKTVAKLEAHHTIIVPEYEPPSLEDDMADIGVAVFGGNVPQPEEPLQC